MWIERKENFRNYLRFMLGWFVCNSRNKVKIITIIIIIIIIISLQINLKYRNKNNNNNNISVSYIHNLSLSDFFSHILVMIM